MAASITSKVPPVGLLVGGTITVGNLFTFVQSSASNYNFDLFPASSASRVGNTITLLNDGILVVTATHKTLPAITASITFSVDEVPIPVPNVEPIDLILYINHHAAGGVTICVICGDAYDGTWKIQASPNKTDWINVEGLIDQTATLVMELPYKLPYFRFTTAPGTVGYAEFFAFGPGVESIE